MSKSVHAAIEEMIMVAIANIGEYENAESRVAKAAGDEEGRRTLCVARMALTTMLFGLRRELSRDQEEISLAIEYAERVYERREKHHK